MWSHPVQASAAVKSQLEAAFRPSAPPGDADRVFERIARSFEQSFEQAVAAALTEGEAPRPGAIAADTPAAEPARVFLSGAAGPVMGTRTAVGGLAGIPGDALAAANVPPIAWSGGEPTPMAEALAPALEPPLRPSVKQWQGLVEGTAARHGVPAWLVQNVLQVESGGNPAATSPAGAMGLMQLMPGTARELGVTEPYDPAQNLDGGVRYLAQMLKRFDGDLEKAVAAYNAGPGAVQRFDGVPPYTETQRYVEKVLAPLKTKV